MQQRHAATVPHRYTNLGCRKLFLSNLAFRKIISILFVESKTPISVTVSPDTVGNSPISVTTLSTSSQSGTTPAAELSGLQVVNVPASLILFAHSVAYNI